MIRATLTYDCGGCVVTGPDADKVGRALIAAALKSTGEKR